MGANGAKEQFEDTALRADALDAYDPAEDMEATLAVLVVCLMTSGAPTAASFPPTRCFLGRAHASSSQITERRSAMLCNKHLPS